MNIKTGSTRIKKRATNRELQAAVVFLDNLYEEAFEAAKENLSPLGLAVMDKFVHGILGRARKLQIDIEWELETREDWKKTKERFGFV